jgi:diguanylate cyclase (GGDEF)-like protein
MNPKKENGQNELNLKAKLKELESCNERYKIVLEQSNIKIFEYNILEGSLCYCTSFEDIFGVDDSGVILPQSILDNHMIYPDDIEGFGSLFEKIDSGAPCSECEFRIKNKSDDYSWYRIQLKTIFDSRNKPVRAVGQICDITCQKHEVQELIQKAQHDDLTGLLNKAAAQQFAEKSLKENTVCALFIIDVDHFKNINDSLGHMFGDTVLAEVGGCLRKLFRSTDIIGRIGGDEFMVLLRDVKDSSLVLEKAEALNLCLNQTLFDQTEYYSISGSIGVAVYPKDGQNYNELFQKADIALYHAKRSGRNSCVIYSVEDENSETKKLQTVPVLYPVMKNTAPNNTSRCSEVLPIVSDLLFQAADINNVLYTALKYIGEEFRLSRVYLFGNSKEINRIISFQEWRASGISPKCEKQMQYVEEDISVFLKTFQSDTLCCSEIVNLPEPYRSFYRKQGTHATVQVALRENGLLKGCIGFDDCLEDRLWTQEELDILISAARIIYVFIQKKQAEFQVQTAYENAKAIMESISDYCYLIDTDTYHILYANQKMMRSSFAAVPNDRCYTVFGNGITPCEDCPLRFTNPVKHRIFREGTLTLASCSKMQWHGSENAVLICCHEISSIGNT